MKDIHNEQVHVEHTTILPRNGIQTANHSAEIISRESQKTILLVDDNAELLELYSFFLEKKGFRINSFIGVLEAMDSFLEDPPDLVITDITMPIFTGNILCRLVKGGNKTIPVFALTGEPESVENHFDAVLRKPLELKILLQQVNLFLFPDTSPS